MLKITSKTFGVVVGTGLVFALVAGSITGAMTVGESMSGLAVLVIGTVIGNVKVAGFLRINGAGESGLKPFVVSFKLVN